MKIEETFNEGNWKAINIYTVYINVKYTIKILTGSSLVSCERFSTSVILNKVVSDNIYKCNLGAYFISKHFAIHVCN